MRPSTVLDNYDLRHLYKEVTGHYPDDEEVYESFVSSTIALAESLGYEFLTSIHPLDLSYYVFIGVEKRINGLRDALEVKLKSTVKSILKR